MPVLVAGCPGRATGASCEVVDPEAAVVNKLTTVLDGADLVVLAAGAGPGHGVEGKDILDRAAALAGATA